MEHRDDAPLADESRACATPTTSRSATDPPHPARLFPGQVASCAARRSCAGRSPSASRTDLYQRPVLRSAAVRTCRRGYSPCAMADRKRHRTVLVAAAAAVALAPSSAYAAYGLAGEWLLDDG